MTQTGITIKASEAIDNRDGTFTVVIETRELTREESALLDGLFPDLEGAVGVLLSKQALLSAVKR